MHNDQTESFKEVQRFDQPWLWILLISLMLVVVGSFGYGMFQQLVLGLPWGERPLSDTALLLVGVASLLLFGGIIMLFRSLRLITEVMPEGLAVRFHPLHRKLIPYRQIKSCHARSYRPLLEYGGWGIKYGPSGRAYNVKGERGVQLVLEDGKRILIGSQHADELERAIKRKGV
jgi:hypothetical protein